MAKEFLPEDESPKIITTSHKNEHYKKKRKNKKQKTKNKTQKQNETTRKIILILHALHLP